MEAYRSLSKQATKAMFKIVKDAKGMLSPRVALQLFDALVIPILEYGGELLNVDSLEMEKVHTRFIKMVLGVNNKTSNLAVYGETGRFPLVLRRQLKSIKFWCKILALPDDNILKMVYNNLLTLTNVGFKTWVSRIEDLLCKVNMSHLFEEQKCSKFNIIEYEKAIYEMYVTEWFQEINDVAKNPKLRTYCLFKLDFEMEHYLLNVLDVKLRKSISRFRTSNHNLEIERGRHCKPVLPVELRTCKLCDTAVEDEIHFLCDCPFFSEERNHLYRLRSNLDLENDFVSILSCKETCFYLGKALYAMMRKRKEKLI